jgi:hypothetical protein
MEQLWKDFDNRSDATQPPIPTKPRLGQTVRLTAKRQSVGML